jgi:hypothetical protein
MKTTAGLLHLIEFETGADPIGAWSAQDRKCRPQNWLDKGSGFDRPVFNIINIGGDGKPIPWRAPCQGRIRYHRTLLILADEIFLSDPIAALNLRTDLRVQRRASLCENAADVAAGRRCHVDSGQILAQYPSGCDGFEDCLATPDIEDPGQVVGQYMQRHFG